MYGSLRRRAVADPLLAIAATLGLTACRAEPANAEVSAPALRAPSESESPEGPDAPPANGASQSPVDDVTAPADAATVDAAPTTACCRTCRKGKACGNTCVAVDRRCESPPGCACDATETDR
jgi:hypothetical protein